MPELPEVETVRTCLAPKVAGGVIESVWTRRGARVLRDAGPGFARALKGRRVEGVGRRGKYLLFALDSGDILVIHLGMTGRLFTQPPGGPYPDHTHIRINIAGADLVLADPRTFGRAFVVPAGTINQHPAFRQLGPEPLDNEFNTRFILEFVSGRKTSIKALLLGQKLAAGVGNIYADEACFGARLRPDRMAGSLTRAEAAALCRALRSALRRSIALKGTTFRDYQWDAGKSGGFIARLQVYGREGQACRRCRGVIARQVTAGRSTFFCPDCQA